MVEHSHRDGQRPEAAQVVGHAVQVYLELLDNGGAPDAWKYCKLYGPLRDTIRDHLNRALAIRRTLKQIRKRKRNR